MSEAGLRQILLVGSGGFLGSILRYLMSGWVYRLVPDPALPWGTLAVNVVGCVAIGVLGGLAEFRSLLGADARLFMMIGVLGGYTTFSTFGFEGLGLLRDQQFTAALGYVVLHVLLGFGGAWLGFSLARSL